MPFERTIVSGGKKYRQLVESRWDPEKKQSRIHVIKHLGRVVEKDGEEKLIPAQLKIDSVDRSYPIGTLALFWKVAEEFQIAKCISKSIGEEEKDTSTAILILVLNQLIGRKPLTRIQNWISETPLPRWTQIDVNQLTKDHFLNALDKISNTNESPFQSYSYHIQNNLANGWREIIGKEPERFFFYQDITRIRWNGNQTYWAENGYGAQTGRPHLGFGLIVSKDNYMPVAGYPVRGAHPDSTTIEAAVNNLTRWNLKGITLIWDRGLVSKTNIDYARSRKFHLLSCGPRTSDEVIDRLSKYADSDIETRANVFRMSRGNVVYCMEEVGSLYGSECKIVVMLDPERRNHSRIERDLLLQKLESETHRSKRAELIRSLKPLVNPARGRRGYQINEIEEALARKLDGRSLFFSTDVKMSGKEIVRTYFQKDYIEKAFRFLRGDACLAPVRYQLPGRVEAYLSVINFISYELIAAILWKIKKHQLNVSYKELIEETSKIHEVEFTSKNSKIYKWTHISKDTEKLLKPFNIQSLQT